MKRHRQEGLTLIEVLVSLAIFGIISAAVLGMFPLIFKMNRQTQVDQVITIEAKKFMEGARIAFTDQTKFELGKSKLPDAPAASNVGGYTCTSDAPATMSGTKILWREVKLSCELTGQPTYTFVLKLGNPTP